MTVFSKRMQTAEPSVVRELYKLLLDSDMHSLGAGNPSARTFPIKEMDAISRQLYREALDDRDAARALFSYGMSEGEHDLVDALKDRYMRGYGYGDEARDGLQVFCGAQQVIDLTSRILLNAGDGVLVEEQSYSGAISAFRGHEAHVLPVRMDCDGMIPEELDRMLDVTPNVKLIYTIPTFQNPMGIVTSLGRRKAIYDIAVRHDVIILEDGPYFELRYSGDYVPAIKTFDATGHVIFAGSLSKIMAPGLRLGFAIAPKPMLAKLTIGKQCEDVGNPGYPQILAARYMRDYDLDAHIRDCCELYRRKRDIMLDSLDKYLAGKAMWTRPDGGFFIWLTLPEGMSGNAFAKYLIDHKRVLTVCGSAYRPDGADVNAIRLNFSVPEEHEIVDCVRCIGEALDEYGDGRKR